MKKLVLLFTLFLPVVTTPMAGNLELLEQDIAQACKNNKKIDFHALKDTIQQDTQNSARIAEILRSYKDTLSSQAHEEQKDRTFSNKTLSIVQKCCDYSSATLKTIRTASLVSLAGSMLVYGSSIPRYETIEFTPQIEGKVSIAELSRMIQAKKNEFWLNDTPTLTRKYAFYATTLSAVTALCTTACKYMVDYIGTKANSIVKHRANIQENMKSLDALLSLVEPQNQFKQ